MTKPPDGIEATQRPPKPEFNPELDGVRGMAMAAAFLFHCAPKTGVAIIDGFIGSLWLSIDVFFALSGFLITRNLLDDQLNTYRYRNFYVNRALRIVPAYMLTLFVVFGLLSHNDAIAKALQWIPSPWWFLTYAFNIQVALHDGWPPNHLMNHFWSLSVEEQFYLLWPPVVYMVHPRWRVHLIVGMCLVAAAAEISLRLLNVHPAVIHSSLPTRLDSLGVGAAIAFVHRSSRRDAVVPLLARVFWICLVVLLICGIVAGGLRLTGWQARLIVQPTLAAWSAALVYLLINGRGAFLKIARVFRMRVFVFLGTYSYGIYLFHWIIFSAVDRLDAFGWRTSSPWANFALVAVATLAAALLSYNVMEKQFLKLKLRTFRPRTLSPTLPASGS